MPETKNPLSLQPAHLDLLESEAIHIIREVAANFSNPVMLYSIGKDSSVLLHLAKKAFYPAHIPFPLLHIDTTWKFKDMIAFRDKIAQQDGIDMLVHTNADGLSKGINPFDHDAEYTYIMKTQALLQALESHSFDAAIGGARRDEEQSRAKERIFSYRNANHGWDPKTQKPEIWSIYNTHMQKGQSVRVFPLSNWSELDIWRYILRENIDIVPLYFAKKRPVIKRDDMLIMLDDSRIPLKKNEKPEIKKVRFRTLGCYPLSGAIESSADTLEKLIDEIMHTRLSERQGRFIDKNDKDSMEKKKREGYF
ncbi:MAG: sulfate adenylyltransferase subunit CysD [Alphaproteobacteria bacterium]